MERLLAEKTAVVTGASSGIGRAIAERLGAAGATVFICGRSKEGLAASEAAIFRAGGRAISQALDLEQPGALAALVKRAAKEAGRLDIMVNNSGVMHVGAVGSDGPAKWREMINVNLLALLEGCQAAIQAMRETKSEGSIVNISSLGGRRDGLGTYGATKAAVDYLGRSLRLELQRDRIRVTNIVPGAFDTNLNRSFAPAAKAAITDVLYAVPKDATGRSPVLGLPDDIARAVLFVVTQPFDLSVGEIVMQPTKDISFKP